MKTLDLIYIANKWRRLLITQFIVVSIISVGISLILPKWYLPRSVIMPPSSDLSSMGMMSLLGSVSLQNIGLPGMQNVSSSFIAILKSRTIHEEIIEKFGLIDVYKSKNIDWALKTFNKRLEIGLLEEGTIEVGFLDKDPLRASEIVNYLVERLDHTYTRLSVTQAKFAREFVGKRLEENKNALKSIEESINAFQKRHKAISLPDQVTTQIGTYAELKAQLAGLEIEKQVLGRSFSKDHAQLKLLELKISAVRTQLRQFESGTRGEGSNRVFIPLHDVPDISLTYARLMRDYTVEETIFKFLTQQYEQEKIKEAKDTPNIQILDRARPPQKKHKPKRAVIVLLAVFFSGFLSMLMAVAVEEYRDQSQRNTEAYRKISVILSSFRK